MNENKDSELFYILPYTISYNIGGYYRNNDTHCTDYRSPSTSIWAYKSLFFDEKEELLKWFYKNTDKPIPTVYRIKYITNYKGLDDVIKISNLSNNETKFYTAINKDAYAWYDVEKSETYGKDVWNYCYRYRYSIEGNEKFILKDIYEEFSKRDIKIKCNVYKKDVDKTEYFEFVGAPFYLSGKEKAKNKQLILYRPSSKSF